jgi:prefoldin subunit 5
MAGIFTGGGGEGGKNEKEKIRANRRCIQRAVREIDREITRLQQEERRTVQELKKAAASGQQVCILMVGIIN